MSENEKDIPNEKEQIMSCSHFLDQLKYIIHNSKGEIKKGCKISAQSSLISNNNNLKTEKKTILIKNEVEQSNSFKEVKIEPEFKIINLNNLANDSISEKNKDKESESEISNENYNKSDKELIQNKNNTINNDNDSESYVDNEIVNLNSISNIPNNEIKDFSENNEDSRNKENNDKNENNIENKETNSLRETTEENSTKEIDTIINDSMQEEKLKNNEIQKEEESNDNNTNKIKEEKNDNNLNNDGNGLNRLDSNGSKKSEKGEKHKTSPSCLNNCIKWTIKVEIKSKHPFPKNFKSKYTFNGTSVFFKKLDYSILNILHNSLSMTKKNYLANELPHINTHELLEQIKTESNNKLNNATTNKITSSPIKDNITSSVRDLLNINYPIDNSKFNYSIIDANLCIKDNLKNVFLLEFDLEQVEDLIFEGINNENKDKEDLDKDQNNKDLREINDECVDREIYFILNGNFHGNKIFKNDLTFSVEYREFIKSMQFRIQNYQTKLIEASKKNKNKKIQNMQTSFFGKVLTNINLGIEFSKPQYHEIMQTNFNSIVNSHIVLNKILIELTIPNIFINNNKLNISNIFEGDNENSNSNIKEKTSVSSPKKENQGINTNLNVNQNDNFNNKNNFGNSTNNYNYMFNSNMTSPNVRTIGINRSIPASPHLNDFQKLIYQQKYSPLINNNMGNNNININNNFPNQTQNSFFSSTPNYPRSPASGINLPQMFCSPQPNTYSPLSASLMMMQMPYMGRMMQQPLSINSPFNMSNYSSPYIGMGTNKNNSGLNSSNQQRKSSECFPEKIIMENTMNTIGKKIYNSNHQTPIMMKRNDEEVISRINLNQYMSPRSMGPTSSFNLGNNMNSTSFNLNLNNQQFNTINRTYYQLNPMNNINQMNQMGNMNNMGQAITIRQKLFESVKKEEVDRINKTLNSMNRVRPNNNNNINNINNMNNINNINNINSFNNSNTNKNIRNNNMKNNNINNMNTMKNISNMHNVPNIPNIPNISNILNMPNMSNKSNFNKINNLKNEKEETKQRIKNMFIIENQNMTNLDIFLKSVTPLYKKDIEIDFLKLKIKDVFENLKLISLHGLENTYYNYGELIHIWYSLSLSSISIKVTNKQLISQIFEEIKKNKKKPDTLVLKEKEEISFLESLYTLYFTTEHMEITFTETKPVHFRKSFSQLINFIMKSIPFFDKITVGDINLNESYFAILYSSFKSSKPHTNHSSFVVYYHFTKEILQENKNGNLYNNEKYFKQTVIGILPLKISSDFFFQRISFNNNLMIYKGTHIPLFGYFNNDTLLLRNMIYSIINQVPKYTRSHSYDYDLFIKLNKYNYNN